LVLETHHEVISPADNYYVAFGFCLAPVLHPEVEHVVQVDVERSFELAVQPKNEEQSSYLRVKHSPITEKGDILIVLDDLTRLKEAQDTIRAYTAELESSNADLDAFSHTVAHDLRRPLTHIMGYTDLIKEFSKDELSPESTEFLVRIDEAVLNMNQMIQSLLMLAQLREATEVVELVDMSSLIDDALHRTQPDLEKRGVHVEVKQPIPDALGYRPWLEEVFANLINNAVQYIGHENPAPTIILRATPLDDCVRYEVIDNGLGISLENQPRLFEM
jgi:signal transduction histidine kinase